MKNKSNKQKTQSQKKKERLEKYLANKAEYDVVSSLALCSLYAVMDNIEKANEVFPEIFTNKLIAEANRTLNYIYQGNKFDRIVLAEEQMNIAKPIVEILEKLKEIMLVEKLKKLEKNENSIPPRTDI